MVKGLLDQLSRDGEYKKYRSTHEEIQRIRSGNEAQRQRDEAARERALRSQTSSANRNATNDVRGS